MMPRRLRVFCDFDGTITVKDVGATLFNHFSSKNNAGTVKLWIERKIDSRECLRRECAYIRGNRAELIAALNQIEIAPGFPEFLQTLNDRQIPLHVVSDGLDFYIDAFFTKAGLGNLDIHANRGYFIDGTLHPGFPYFARGCGFCGTCKGERISSLTKPEELSVYIGDGYSDRCAAGVAQLIFAKGDLVRICQERQVEFIPFHDFHDVNRYFAANLF